MARGVHLSAATEEDVTRPLGSAIDRDQPAEPPAGRRGKRRADPPRSPFHLASPGATVRARSHNVGVIYVKADE